jgi:flagellar assembly protein FliH
VEKEPEDTVDPVQAAEAEARERGYREGRERAKEELAREVESARSELSAALQRLARLEAELTAKHEAALLESLVEAVSRVVRRQLEAGDPVAARALEEALASLPDATTYRARLHPDDLPSVTESLGSEVEAGRLELVADATIRRGGAIVECEAGRADATLETAEAAVAAAIRGGDETP